MTSLSEGERLRLLKPLDSAWTVLVIDPPAMRLLPRLARVRRITPVHVTVLAQALGAAAVVAFAAGNLVLGAVLFELRFFVDCLDGKLARLRGETSRFGAMLDANGDRVSVTASFAALAWSADAAWLAVAVTTSYLLGFAFRELRDESYAHAGVPKPIERASLGGLAAQLRRRRIYPTVTTIEVEHAALFVVPLFTAIGVDVVEPALVVAATYFGLQALRFGVAALRAAAVADRTDQAPRDPSTDV